MKYKFFQLLMQYLEPNVVSGRFILSWVE